MISQLFVGFIAYTIERLGDYEVSAFQQEVKDLVDELQEVEPALISWYADLKEYWAAQIEDDEVEEGEEKFLEFIKSLDSEKLIELATDIRNDLMLEDVANLTYDVASFTGIFVVKWNDGMQVEIKCNPVFSEESQNNFEFDAIKIDEVLSAFKQQIVELMIQPGFDSMHDQSATPFPKEKYRELYSILVQYVDSKDSSERGDYEYILKRFRHFFEEDDIPDDGGNDLKWLDNGGGF